jgi:hypothetical protein
MTTTRKPPAPGLDPAPLLALYPCRDDGYIAERLDVSRSAVKRWRDGTRLIRPGNADRLADAAGRHRWDLWPHLRDTDLADVERTCERPDCDTTYVPERSNQKYCGRRCQTIMAKRAYYRRKRDDQAFREQRIAESRAYYEACRTAALAKQRRRDRARAAAQREVAA